MTTTVVKTIGSGGDYSTLAAWFAGCPANLVTADQIWQGQIKNASDVLSTTSGNALNLTGITVNATRYVELTTATGAGFNANGSVPLRYDTANGCAITSNAGYVHVIVINQDFCRLSNLQIASTGSKTIDPIQMNSSFTCTIDKCVLSVSGNTAAFCADMFGSNAVLSNSLCEGRINSMSALARFGSSAKAYFCDFVVPSNITAATNAVNGFYGAATYENCNFFGVTGVTTGGSAPTFTTCRTSVGSPPSGCTTTTYNTSAFNNITDATRDFRLPSGSALIGSGTADSNNGPTDIFGTARPQSSSWDVGAFEFFTTSAGGLAYIGGGGGGGSGGGIGASYAGSAS